MKLRCIGQLCHFQIQASDTSAAGYLSDLLFDDESWNLRYLVLRKNDWLRGRSMLVEPMAIAVLDIEQRILRLRLSTTYVQDSPSLKDHPPMYVQRQAELDLRPPLWSAYGGVYDPAFAPIYISIQERLQRETAQEDEQYIRSAPLQYDVHLRSVEELCHYSIVNGKDKQARVIDFVVNSDTWHLDELIVGTGSWFAHKQRSIPTTLISRISWKHQMIDAKAVISQQSSHAV